MNTKQCIVSLTGDPITVGHRDIVKRASKMFSFIYVLIPKTSSKAGHLLSFEQRVQAIREDLESDGVANFDVQPISGALVDGAKRLGCNFIVRGLRNEQDLIYEMDMGSVNRMLDGDVETIYLSCKPELSFVSSSMVRELVKLGKYETAEKFTSASTMKLLKRASTKVVALGGGIACGKSTVRDMFSRAGWTVIDCDAVNREMVLKSPSKLEEIKKALGPYGDVDSLDPAKSIASVVFKSEEARTKLEAIAFPAIASYIKRLCEDWRICQSRKILVEVPLLFEDRASGFNHLFDKTVFVVSRRDEQIDRLVKKGYTRDEALARMATQTAPEIRAKKADYVLENHNGLFELESQVEKVLEQL